jgi:hypothetical protein
MAITVYERKGNISLKEKAMVREVEKAINLLKQDDPNFTFNPAKTPSELEDLYNEYAISDVEYEESTKETEPEDPSPTKETPSKTESSNETTEKQIDPFNREEPIVRDYVLNEEFPDENVTSTKTSFDEPLSFDESFSIPDSETMGSRPQPAPEQKTFVEPEQPSSQEPINPAFNEMDSAKQRKKTKRFAKQIVALTCDLLEKGFEWYTMKDITEAKLTEYEINNEMDLLIQLDVSENQQMSVKDFFLSQHAVIKEESKIDAEDREDLTDALTEVFLEKGIAPTPIQELLLVGARIVGLQTLKAVAIANSHNSILSQLRGMKQEEQGGYDNYEATPEPTYTAPPPPQRRRQPPPQEQQQQQVEIVEQVKAQNSTFEEVMFPVEIVKE